MVNLLSFALCTLADVKGYLEISAGDTTKDELLKRLINSATRTIERYVGNRRFDSTAYTNEVYSGDGTRFLKVRNWPVTALTSLQFRTDGFNTPNWEDFETDFFNIETSDDQNDGVILSNQGFRKGIDNIRVSYVAGFTTIPEDVTQACIELVDYLFQKRKSSGIKSESMGDRTVTYFDQKSSSPIEALGLDDVLDNYRDFKF